MKFIGYFDINGMSVHQAISHLTDRQKANYRQQIGTWLAGNHFIVDRTIYDPGVDLAIVSDTLPGVQQTPAGPVPVQIPRLRLQYTVNLDPSPTAPTPSGLILPGAQNGQQQLTQISLTPLPDDTDAPQTP